MVKTANKIYFNQESLTWNHQKHFRKNKHSLQNHIKYECDDIKYKRYSKPKQFKSNIKAYRVGFCIGYKTGSYDGHRNIYNKYDMIGDGYQDDSHYIGQLKGYDIGYKYGKDCKQCNNKYDFDGYQQNMIGLHWISDDNMNNEHMNLIELKWSDDYGYYSYDSFGWTLYTELSNKNDAIYNGMRQDIKAELNKKLKIPIYKIQMKTGTKRRKNNRKNNIYFQSNANRIYIGANTPKQYIYKYSAAFLKWAHASTIRRYTRYYNPYNGGIYSEINGVSCRWEYRCKCVVCCQWSCKCTNYNHLSKCDIKVLANTLCKKYKNICSDVLRTIVPDLRQTRQEIGYTMMYNTPFSNHGSDIVYLVLDFVFATKIIDYYYQIERDVDLCTKMNGDNFINTLKKLDKDLDKTRDKKFDKMKLLKQVHIYDELQQYINDNGGNVVVKYLNRKKVKNIVSNVRKYGTKYYQHEIRSDYDYDFDYFRTPLSDNCVFNDYDIDYYDVDLTLSNINYISYTKLNVEYKDKNKWKSSFVKKKYRKNNKRVFSKKKNKKIRRKEKKEMKYKRWNKMRKHTNDTKNRFNLQYHLKGIMYRV